MSRMAVMPACTGELQVRKASKPSVSARDLICDLVGGHYKPGIRTLPVGKPIQYRLLCWLRDHVHRGIPRAWYNLVLGHDLHIGVYASLSVKHFHTTQRDPFNPHKIGWLENLGVVSHGLVTTAFRDDCVDELQASGEFFDYKYHEVGTDNTAEDNTHTALIATSGIGRVTGTQTEGATADIYKSVATVTADATEPWQEHGIFSNVSGACLMDRSLISPAVSVVPSDTCEFTYEITFNAEA